MNQGNVYECENDDEFEALVSTAEGKAVLFLVFSFVMTRYCYQVAIDFFATWCGKIVSLD
jgi:hypothetical protein